MTPDNTREALQALASDAMRLVLDASQTGSPLTVHKAQAKIQELAALAQPAAIEPERARIDHDESMNRDYIPLPAGWELQTKGKGSSLRLLDKKAGERYCLPLPDFMIEFVERMGREVYEATANLHAAFDAAPAASPVAQAAETESIAPPKDQMLATLLAQARRYIDEARPWADEYKPRGRRETNQDAVDRLSSAMEENINRRDCIRELDEVIVGLHALAQKAKPEVPDIGFSPMWLAPIDGTPVLLHLPTTTDKFAVGRWCDGYGAGWTDDEGGFYTHTPTGFMALHVLERLAAPPHPEQSQEGGVQP